MEIVILEKHGTPLKSSFITIFQNIILINHHKIWMI